MKPQTPLAAADRSGLIWGWEFRDGTAHPIDDIGLNHDHAEPAAFRWLHLNLADQRAQRWIAGSTALPAGVRTMFLSNDSHQQAVIEPGAVGVVLHDIERDFDDGELRVGVLRLAVTASMMITARHHPVRSADVVKARIVQGTPVANATAAIEMTLSAMAEVLRATVTDIDAQVERVEDGLLRGASAPDARAFVILRSLMVRLHRLLHGARTVLGQLEETPGCPGDLAPVTRKAAERLALLDGELLATQAQLRLLREELDLQATQRTNQNVYILSILTAVMMPATLVTGVFGMNTGGFPWAMAPYGTAAACALAVGSAAAVYVVLRRMGFFRR